MFVGHNGKLLKLMFYYVRLPVDLLLINLAIR